MEYYSILNLKKEPFSNSPDPDYFFQSKQHFGCLQKLELSIRLRRGLNVVIGDVGAGKTTLCRHLIRRFASDESFETHLILDPSFNNPLEFLATVAKMFRVKGLSSKENQWSLKEKIKRRIFHKGVDEDKTVILVIDEGQKLPVFCHEILREFLNYETNEYKLLQIVIFAQREFEDTLQEHENFADRINLYHMLEPMNFRDTRAMIQFRLTQASDLSRPKVLFSYPALKAIYRATGGYPRKIINLCHRCILAMIIQNRNKIGWFIVRSCVKRDFHVSQKRWPRMAAGVAVGLALVLMVSWFEPDRLKKLVAYEIKPSKTLESVEEPPEGETGSGFSSSPIQAGSNETDHNLSKEESTLTLIRPLTMEEETGGGMVSEPETETGENLSEQIPVEKEIPEMLGRVELNRHETLSWMMVKVYGLYNKEQLAVLNRANPHIPNPDTIEVGKPVYFPAIPLHSLQPLENVWWLKIAEKESLEDAFAFLRGYPEKAPPARIIPYWEGRTGLGFALVLWEYYFDKDDAQKKLNGLRTQSGVQGEIISLEGDNRVYFSDPFLSKRKSR